MVTEAAIKGQKTDQVSVMVNTSKIHVFIILICGIFIMSVLSLICGRYSINLHEITKVFWNILINKAQATDNTLHLVLFNVRLPRLMAAIVVGAALSGSGACYQAIFRNPMVEPSLLGVTFGAAFGAAIAILLSFSLPMIQVTAFCFGLLAVSITVILSNVVSKHNDNTLTLILCGIITSAVFSAFLSLTKYVADPNSKLPAITYWLMGSLASDTMGDVIFCAMFFLIGFTPLMLLRWQINALSFGDDEAKTLGINTRFVRMVAVISSTMMTASAVSISGKIDWIGLVIPHLARILVGPSLPVLLPASVLLGALYLLVVDTVSRLIFPVEIPLGIVTAIIGAPFFVALLFKVKRGWI